MTVPITRTDRPDPAKIKNFPKDGKLSNRGHIWYVVKRDYFYKNEIGRGSEKKIYLGRVVNNEFLTMEEYKLKYKRNGKLRVVPNESDIQNEVKVDSKIKRNTLLIGANALVFGAIENTHIEEDLLDAGFTPVQVAYILKHSCFNISTGSNAFYLNDEWQEDKVTTFMQNTTAKESSLFLQMIGKEHGKIENLFKKRQERLGENEVLSVDSTTIKCESENITYSAVGVAKDKQYQEQIGCYIVLSHDSKMPVMYRFFSGNTHDTSTMKDILKRESIYKSANPHVFDKGYYSLENLAIAKENNIKVLVSMKDKIDWAKQIIDKHYDEIIQSSNHIRGYGVRGMTFKHTEKVNGTNIDLWLHVFYDEVQAANAKARKNKELDEFELAYEAEDKKALVNTKMLKYFNQQKNEDGSITLTRNYDVIDKENRFKGIFMNVTNYEEDCATNINNYSSRDVIEKGFKYAKSEAEFDKIRAHSDDALNGRGLVGFISMILLSDIYKQMNKAEIKVQKNGKKVRVKPVIENFSFNVLKEKLNRCKIYVYTDGSLAISECEKEKGILAQMGYKNALDYALEQVNKKF